MTKPERVYLRPVDFSDASAIQKWYAEPQVVEYAIIQPFLGYSLSEVQDLIKKWLGRDDRKLYVLIRIVVSLTLASLNDTTEMPFYSLRSA